MTFDEFYNGLIEDGIWWDRIQMQYRSKDIKGEANNCFTWLLTQQNRMAAKDFGDFRRAFQKFLMNAKDVPIKPQLQQAPVVEEVKPKEPPLTGEARQARLKEWMEQVQKGDIVKPVGKLSYKEIADEGGWLPKKPAPYPSTNESEVLKRLIHQEYIRTNYDPRTQDKLPGWMIEEDWVNSKPDHYFDDLLIEFKKKVLG